MTLLKVIVHPGSNRPARVSVCQGVGLLPGGARVGSFVLWPEAVGMAEIKEIASRAATECAIADGQEAATEILDRIRKARLRQSGAWHGQERQGLAGSSNERSARRRYGLHDFRIAARGEDPGLFFIRSNADHRPAVSPECQSFPLRRGQRAQWWRESCRRLTFKSTTTAHGMAGPMRQQPASLPVARSKAKNSQLAPLCSQESCVGAGEGM
jgi:hypothetical protein